MNYDDYITFGCWAFAFAFALSVLAYLIGRSHRIDTGYNIGVIEEHRRKMPKIIQAKREGCEVGRIWMLNYLSKKLN